MRPPRGRLQSAEHDDVITVVSTSECAYMLTATTKNEVS